MSKPSTIGLFVEDRAHEEFLSALLHRLADQEGKMIEIDVKSARGGRPRVMSELDIYQREPLEALRAPARMVVVAIDCNCKTFNAARKEVENRLDASMRGRAVAACPDPHIERWYLADPDSFAEVVGIRPHVGRRRCERARYKKMLSDAIREAGHPPTLGGIDFARDIVEKMDLFRAGKAETSLKHFVDDVRVRLRSL